MILSIRLLPVAAGVFLALAQSGAPPRATAPGISVASVRVLFGLTDADPTSWDGNVSIETGAVKAIQGWRFGPEDSTDYTHSWKAATRAQGNPPDNILENGVLITAESSPEARWTVHTPKGDFSFTLHDVAWGDQKTFLDGSVAVDRVPPTTQLTTSDDDEDFPAIAHSGNSGNEIWMTFTRFSHSDRTLESFANLPKEPDNFNYLARPAGGDQVFATRFSPDTATWSSPVPVSPKGEDAARTAIAIDGRHRVWVIWSAQRNAHFNLFARIGDNGSWGPEFQVTSGAGPDLNPVAATDSSGRVWLSWQGFRNGNLEVLAAVQSTDTFSPETTVSFSPASDWDPAIAAASNGEVSIAWDTYDKGDYDVYFRPMQATATAPGITMQPPVAVATTMDFEARPSVTYDTRNRLWVAYEAAGPRWGKQFGAFETTGTPLYEDRNIRIKCFDGANSFTTSSDLINVLPGPPATFRRSSYRFGAMQRSNRVPLAPNPDRGRNRRPKQWLQPRNASLNELPRLTADPAGGIYLAFRSLDGPFNSRSPVGSVWFEHVVYFDGHNWVGPVFLPRTDGLMDNRPALLALEPGHLLTVSAMDHRQSIPNSLGAVAADRINSDLYAADLRLDGLYAPAARPELMSLRKEVVPPTDPRVKEEADQIAAIRNYRIDAGGQQLRILRGDFNRHTEYSADGGREGSLTDAWRYMIDAAALDWGGCCDNESAGGHEYFWWIQQKMTDAYHLGGIFTTLFSDERPVRYPEGERNMLFAKRGIRPLPHLATVPVDSPPALPAPDTRMLYKYLHAFGGISIPHTTATDRGTDWRNSDPEVEPAVEIYQGSRQNYESETAPRAASADDAIRNWRPLGTVNAALQKGLRLGFIASSDQYSTHMSYANVLASTNTRDAVIDAFRKRRVYASTDNIIADVRSQDHIMGDEFSVTAPPSITVRLIGTAPFAKVTVVKNGAAARSLEPNTKEVNFEWRDDAATSGQTDYYYVRGIQTDGQLVWSSPMWITLKP